MLDRFATWKNHGSKVQTQFDFWLSHFLAMLLKLPGLRFLMYETEIIRNKTLKVSGRGWRISKCNSYVLGTSLLMEIMSKRTNSAAALESAITSPGSRFWHWRAFLGP